MTYNILLVSRRRSSDHSIAEVAQLHLWSSSYSLLASGLQGAQRTESLVLRNRAQILESRLREFDSTWEYTIS